TRKVLSSMEPLPASSAPPSPRQMPSRRGSLSGFQRVTSSLAVQIIALFAVATLFPLVVSLVQTREAALAAQGRALVSAQLVAREATTYVADAVLDARRAAEVVTRMLAFWDGEDADRDQVLAALAAAQPTLNALLYYTPDYTQHGTSNYDPAL